MRPPRHLRADVAPGLTDNWFGPAVMADGEFLTIVGHTPGIGCRVVCSDGIPREYTTRSIRLDLHRPEVQDHLARWLAAQGKPAWHLVDAARTGSLASDQVGEALGWSVLSVARGGGVLRRIYTAPDRLGTRHVIVAEPGCTWVTDDFDPFDPTRDALKTADGTLDFPEMK